MNDFAEADLRERLAAARRQTIHPLRMECYDKNEARAKSLP